MYAQEVKSFRRVHLLKMLVFSSTWMLGSLMFSITTIPLYIIGHRDQAAEVAHYLGNVMGQWMFRIIAPPPDVVGLENLPPDGEKGMVYVSNHQSMLDIAMFYYIGSQRKFSWVSKSSVFLVPGVGCLMKLAKYVALTRGNRNSVRKMFDDCTERIDAGWSVMIFPQGTRRRHKILDFKDGAFTLALETGATVVPFTLYLPEDIFFSSTERAKVTIHKPISPGDPKFKDLVTLRKHCFDTVIGALPYSKAMLEEQQAARAEAEEAEETKCENASEAEVTALIGDDDGGSKKTN
ncbi:unnamed protein product [Choristocarpus tenellus]